MTRLIKKYKNRRLYDTETSQYITLDQLQQLVIETVPFRVEDSVTGKDITNSILLQIIVEMEGGSTQFLSSEVLRHLICLANHPLHMSFKSMIEQMIQSMDKFPYQQATEQMKDFISNWQQAFKPK